MPLELLIDQMRARNAYSMNETTPWQPDYDQQFTEIICKNPNYTRIYHCLPADQDAKLWVVATEIIAMSVIALFGLIGNTLALVVLSRDKKSSSTNLILKALAVWDILSLLLAVTSNTLRNYIYYFHEDGNYEAYAETFAKALIYGVIPLHQSALYGSVSMTVMVSIDRYIAVCKPMAVRKRVHVILTISLISIYVTAFYIPTYFEHAIIPYVGLTKENWRLGKEYYIKVITIQSSDNLYNSQLYQVLYQIVVAAVFRDLGPNLLLIFFNVRLYQALQEMRRRYLRMRRGSNYKETRRHVSSSESLTVTILVVVTTFTFLNLPNLINKVLVTVRQIGLLSVGEDVVPFVYNDNGIYRLYYRTIANLLTVLSSSLNFFIYIIFAKKFRNIFVETFCTCGERSHTSKDVQLSNSSDALRTGASNTRLAPGRSQVAPSGPSDRQHAL